MTEAVNKIPVIGVVGPTASGKTALGVELAKLYDGEVISADSMQIYQGMEIATAKPTAEEMQGIPHHLMNFLPLQNTFSVVEYVQMAQAAIADIVARKKQPILVGGAGLYVDSLLNGIRFSDVSENQELREELTLYAEENGAEALYAKLKAVDPVAAEKIHPNNIVRVIRAIELASVSQKSYLERQTESRSVESPYQGCLIGLDYQDRAILYDRIGKRVDIMIKNGLLEEAFSAWKANPLRTAANAIGYKELIPYFQGTATLEDCIDKIKQETRRYAKRQLTWFRRNPDIHWIKLDIVSNHDDVIEKCKKIIASILAV